MLEGVSFKFEFVHGSQGNFLYIDNIKIQDQCDETVANFEIEKDTINLYTTDTAKFINTSINASYWLWDFGDGTTSDEENTTHIYDSTGTYLATLIASNNECVDTISKEIVVINYNSVDYPKLDNNLQIFPNPTTGNITISTENEIIESIEIYNSIGSKVDEIIIKNKTKNFNFNFRQNYKGLYFVKVKTQENVYTTKLIIVR